MPTFFRIAPAVLCLLVARRVVGQEATPTPAPTPTPTPGAQATLHGFVDVYYAWNTNRPADHGSFIPGTSTTGKRANEFALNLASVDLAVDAKPVTLRLIAIAGNGADVVHAGEPTGPGTGRDVLRHVYQASLGYVLPVGRGIAIEGGIYPSHIGFETFLSKDNWNYTRSWSGELSPYYQTGVKATAPLSDHWSVQVHVLNGWQIVGENNDSPAYGIQVAYTSDRLTASFNTFAGPELPDDDAHWRVFGDLVVVLQATPRLQLAAQLDAARQSLPGSSAADWQVATEWLRYAFSPMTALAARADVVHDPDNGISGFPQTLWEGTLTFEYRPHPQLIVKLEGRYDHSTRDVFTGRLRPAADSPELERHQTLLILGAVATF